MKKRRGLIILVLFAILFILSGSKNVQAYSTIHSNEIFPTGTLDSLWLNYTTLPQVSITGSVGSSVYDTSYSGNSIVTGYTYRRAQLYPGGNGAIDSTITANFYNCGMLNGRSVNMKIVYSDIVVNNSGDCYFYWSAFGTNKNSDNEWWYNGVEHAKVRIYFYYSNGEAITNLKNVYLSIFSEDENEGAKSNTAYETYLYENTSMAFRSQISYISTYYNAFIGTNNYGTTSDNKNCISFTYNNVNYIEVELFGANGKSNIGYHFEYTPLTATLPTNPVKTVNKTESQLGDSLTYTIEQKISPRYDSAFHYSALVFSDTIDSNLTYNSLKVYNESGADITASAGSVGYNSSTKKLTYTFNSAYLNSMPYNGQTYKFVINTTIVNNSTSATVTDKATTTINNSYNLDSNTVSTTLKAKVVVHYVNRQGVKIADDVEINGNYLDSYTTSAKEIYAYELYSNSGNTSGTMQKNVTEVTYVYDLRRVNINLTKTIEATDSINEQSLEGARFKLTVNNFASQVSYANPATTYLSTYTDQNGHCIITGVPYGNYNIVEEVIPSKAFLGLFYLNGSSSRINNFNIEINKDENLSYSLKDVAKKMNITIYKEDKETGTTTQGDAHLEGAEYTLYRDMACTDAIETLVIQKNADGTYSATSGWYLVGTYYVKETRAPEGYLIDERVYTVSQDPTKQTDEYSSHTITSRDEVKRNNIEITKYIEETDSTKKQKLSGAIFSATLNSDTTKVYFSSSTDENGYCIIEDLPYGTYTLRESTIPSTAYNGEFYINEATDRSTTFEQFIELDDTERASYTYRDITDVAKKMQIIIYKEDIETGTTTQGDAHLEGAEYTLYRDEACTDAIETVTIQKNADGTYSATSGWYLVGTYYVKETKAPEGYLIDEKIYTIIQDPSKQTGEFSTHTITSKDEVKRNDIDITKYLEETDSTEKQFLKGAEFTAQLVSKISPDSNKEYKATTDNNGHCVITDLPYGTYKIWESKVPDTAYNGEFYINGATVRSTEFEQFIELDDTEREAYVYSDITDVAKKMQITIYKEDTETGNNLQGDATLEGAEYTLYRDEECSDEIETITIQKSADGKFSATSGWYLVGKYWIKETKAPEGYLIDEEVYSVEVVPSQQIEEHSYHAILSKDKVMKGIVRVIKYNNNSSSTDKSSAKGAILRLTLNSNNNVYYEATIDDYGYLEFVDAIDDSHYTTTGKTENVDYPYTIPYGKYTISEVRASDSGEHTYIYNQQTAIEYNEQTQRYIFSDEYVRMRLKIEKYDEETGKKLLNGATFKIWDVNNQKWYEEMIYPSGKFISEFTTNDEGELTINRHLEAGNYVLYEVKAPEGYYLDENLREGSKGYEFTIGVEADGKVVFYHDEEREELEYDLITYDNIPTKMYKHTVQIKDMPQKAIVEVTKIAEQFTKVEENNSEYGKISTPIYEEKGLGGAEFRLIAAEDVVTPDGTVRYTKGQVVSDFVTNENGIGKSTEVYLGKYVLEEIATPNGYIVDSKPIEVNIAYTNQEEKVQNIEVTKKNERQKVELKFEKEFKELEVSRFKFEGQEAIFGIYTKDTLKNYSNQNVLGQDELVDIMVMDENNSIKNNVELPEGEYYVKELYVSNPYKKITDRYDFDVEHTNNVDEKIELTINNGKVINEAKTVDLELLVYPDVIWDELNIDSINDIEDLEEIAQFCGIADKTYGIYLDKECTRPVITIEDEKAEFVTNENGIISIPDMPTGTYYFKELVAPYGYELSDEIIKAEITGEKDLVILKAKEPTIKAKVLEKYDTFTNDVIANVEFEITDKDENVVCIAKTDNQGILRLPIIYFENGEKYYYKEVSSLEMYEKDEEKHEFTAKIDEEECKWILGIIPVGNDRKTIDEVIVRKTDRETGERLEGCVFTVVLLDENGEEYVNKNGEKIYLVKDAVTNEEGEYVIKDVPYGTYRFVEIKAPEGYEMDEDITGLELTVDKNSPDTIIFEVTNTGDIAVVTIVCVSLVCVAGIVFVIMKNRKASINR
ncbi:MAG: SpaA isopeptide-forming pilin-related protein [Clostridia bacterium]